MEDNKELELTLETVENSYSIGICHLCEQDIFLSWSSLNIPYWLHQKDNCQDIYPHTVEMAIMAKQVLFFYLQDHKYLVGETNCQRCNRMTKLSYSKKLQLELNYPYLD